MRDATTIRDVLVVRHHHRARLRARSSVRATAVGAIGSGADFRPALLVFVERKVHQRWLPRAEFVEPELVAPGELRCRTKIIQVGGDLALPAPTSPLQGANLHLRSQLRGEYERLSIGSQLAYVDASGDSHLGTLTAFARSRSGRVGLLTNAHIGEFVGNALSHPDLDSEALVAELVELHDVEPALQRYGTGLAHADEYLKLDCAFAELRQADLDRDVDLQVPVLETADDGVLTIQPGDLGHPRGLELNDASLFPLGTDVLAVGRTMSAQEGYVAAVGYELAFSRHRTLLTDYVIAPKRNDGYFSFGGDSGKLVVTKDDLEPIAMLWGGLPLRTEYANELVDHSFATDITHACKRLGVELLGLPPTGAAQ